MEETAAFAKTKKCCLFGNKQIDYIIELGDRFRQSNLTIHIAVTYLDRALAKYSHILVKKLGNSENEVSKEDHCNLWAVVCLMLASKFNELDSNIPFYSEIMSASSRAGVYTEEQFHTVEEFIIKSVLSWDFEAVTTLHFTQCLAYQGVIFSDDEFTGTPEKVVKNISKKTELFTDLSLISEQIIKSNFEQSKVSAACIVAARKLCKITPLWNNKLYEMTGFHFYTIKEIFDVLIKDYCEFFNEDYAKIMYPSELRSKVVQKPLSFVNRRVSENPSLGTQLIRVSSAKGFKNGDDGAKTVRNTIFCGDKGQKLGTVEGDTASSGSSVPDETESSIDIAEKFEKVNEKSLTRQKTADTEEADGIKVYQMEFKKLKDHVTKPIKRSQRPFINRFGSVERPQTTHKTASGFRNNKPYRYKKTTCIQKPFQKQAKKNSVVNSLLASGYIPKPNHRSTVCPNKTRRVYDTVMNSNSKILSNKATEVSKCKIDLTKQFFRKMRVAPRQTSSQNSFNESFKTSPRLNTLCSSSYINQKSSRRGNKFGSMGRSKYTTLNNQANQSYYNFSTSQNANFYMDSYRLNTEKGPLEGTFYTSRRQASCGFEKENAQDDTIELYQKDTKEFLTSKPHQFSECPSSKEFIIGL